jgi:hypothetical protein
MPHLVVLLTAVRTVRTVVEVLETPEVESRAAYYREQARQIRALIALVVSPDVKKELLTIAEQFERLAETAADSAPNSGPDLRAPPRSKPPTNNEN